MDAINVDVADAAPTESDRHRWSVIGLILCAGCLVSFVSFLMVYRWVERRLGSDLQRKADIMTVDMTHDVKGGLSTIRAIGSLYAVSEHVNRKWLVAEAERILLSQETVRAVAWAPNISDGGRGDYEAAMRARIGSQDFAIMERDLQGRLVRAVRRASHFPVSEYLPSGGAFSEVPAGLDLASDNALHDALLSAWKTGMPAATPPVRIAPDMRETRVVVFAPVYRSASADEARRHSPQKMMGMTVGIIKVSDLVEEVIEEWHGQGIEIAVYDRTNGDQYLLMEPDDWDRFIASADMLRSTTTVHVADRRWTLEFIGTDQYRAAEKTWTHWEIVAMSVILTLCLAGYTSMKMRERAKLDRLVAIRTAEFGQANRRLTEEMQERRQAEEALRESETRFRDMADTVPVMIWLTGPDGRNTFYNKTLLDFTGRSQEQELMDWINGVHPDDRPLIEHYWTVFTRREPFEIEYRQRRADGVYRWTMDRGTPRFLSDGAFAGYIGCGIDVTELKEAQHALRHAHDAAIEASRLKSEFLANMSHEIRTPMNGVLGMTELALRTELSTEQREYLTLVKSSGESLLEIINDILDFSKIEAGHLTLEQVPFSLRGSVGTAIKPLALRAHAKGLELSCHIAPEVPDSLIGDPHRLRQIVVNLIGNAVKFTQRGEVVLRIELEHGESAGGPTDSNGASSCRLNCAVTDTGVGIMLERQSQIFEAFEQADGSTTRQYGGTGLGLTICARLTELMDGWIWVESEPGRGSTFHFNVQFGVQDQKRVCCETCDVPATEGLAGLSVLAVDDNATSRTILEEWLTAWQMRPMLASHGREAMDILSRTAAAGRSIDLCIVDAEMPDVNGFWVVGQMLEQSYNVPTILMLNSTDQPSDIARCRDLGVAAYAVKPVTPSELWNAMMTALSKGGAPKKAVEPLQSTNGDGSSSVTADGRRYRILLAEDNPVNQLLAVRLLEKAGHAVTVAGNGHQALAELEHAPFDLILMDVQMPEMDGFEATAAIRLRERTTGRHIPIVALTAHAMKGDRERCLEAGMDDYLTKPLKTDALFGMITRLVAESADATPASASAPSAFSLQPAPPQPAACCAPAATPDCPFNKAELLERVGGDVELMREIVGLFLEEGPMRMTEIREAIDHEDAPALTKAAHTLKGAVSVFGAGRSREAALRLEQLGRTGDLVQVEEGFRNLESAMTELLPALEALMSEA